MATKVKQVTDKEINQVTDVLGRLVIQGKYAHMVTHVRAVLGGMFIPYLVDQGAIDSDDDNVQELMAAYAKDKIKEMLNPEPITVPVEQIVERIVHCRPVFRRIKQEVKKEKRMQRELACNDRDIMIRWWNVNQRLVPKEDPVCSILADQINAATPSDEPVCSMQVAGFFSHLCRLGLRTEGERQKVFSRSIRRGAHTLEPRYTESLKKAIYKNWEYERANEQARKTEQSELIRRRADGDRTPIIANIQ